MRVAVPNVISGKTWWWGFGLLVAAPAVVLALLGLRAVRADRIEREQQQRDRELQTARLADASIRAALSEIERKLRVRDSAQQEPALQTAEDPDIHLFSLDHSGPLTFTRDRVYFGDSPEKQATTNWQASVEELVEQARAAEAQQHASQAAMFYNHVIAVEPRLRAWARLSLLHLEHKEDTQLLDEILAGESSSEGGVSPSGLPVALVACARVEALTSEERGRYRDIVERTLAQLRASRWWLSFEERSFYDQELRGLLPTSENREYAEPDPRLQLLAVFARVVASAPLRRDEATRHFERTEAGPVLILLSPSQQRPTLWQGVALDQQALVRLLDDLINQTGPPQLGNTWITDEAGNTIWGSRHGNSGGTYSETLSVVPGWTLVFERGQGAGWFDQRTMLWLGFVVMLIVTMLASLAGTMRVVRREAELARMQNDFIAGVSHEFKSPITSIRLLLERMASGRMTSPDSAAEYQTSAERELTRLERHVNRLLEAQQIQVGQRQYKFSPASLSDIAADAIAELAPQAEAKQIRIEREAEPDLPSLQLDRPAMTEAIANLIGNAIKYSPADGRINVATRLDINTVRLEVCDEGIGIDRYDARRIFNRFYRGRNSRALTVNGTGLGLALVRATVQAHGGNITVESAPGSGSRFTISLPLERRLD